MLVLKILDLGSLILDIGHLLTEVKWIAFTGTHLSVRLIFERNYTWWETWVHFVRVDAFTDISRVVNTPVTIGTSWKFRTHPYCFFNSLTHTILITGVWARKRIHSLLQLWLSNCIELIIKIWLRFNEILYRLDKLNLFLFLLLLLNLFSKHDHRELGHHQLPFLFS